LARRQFGQLQSYWQTIEQTGSDAKFYARRPAATHHHVKERIAINVESAKITSFAPDSRIVSGDQ